MAQPGNVELLEDLGLAAQIHQFVAEAAVPDTVVEIKLAGDQAFAELPINPEFVSIPMKMDRLGSFVKVEKVRSQSLGYGTFRNFGKWTLREPLLAVEDILSRTMQPAMGCRPPQPRSQSASRADAGSS